MTSKAKLNLYFAGSMLSAPLVLLHPLLLILPLCFSVLLFYCACTYLVDSQRDSLTGLSNLHRLNQLRRKYHKTSTLTVVYIDLNDLKEINNKHGHKAGNAVLIEVGAFLRQLCRKKEIAYRIGGDEFLLISESTDTADMLQRFVLAQEVLEVGLSFGIATGCGQDLDALIHAADQNMYAMKNGTA